MAGEKGDPSTVQGQFPNQLGGGGGGGGTSGQGIDENTVYEAGTGSIDTGTSSVLGYKDVPDGGALEITLASLAHVDGSPAETGVDLVLFTADGSGGANLEATVLSGDSSTVQVDETGSPLAEYSNDSGGAQVVGAAIDNGDFGGGAGSAVSTFGKVQGQVKL